MEHRKRYRGRFERRTKIGGKWNAPTAALFALSFRVWQRSLTAASLDPSVFGCAFSRFFDCHNRSTVLSSAVATESTLDENITNYKLLSNVSHSFQSVACGQRGVNQLHSGHETWRDELPTRERYRCELVFRFRPSFNDGLRL
ncbi:unnamed protein product [Larinioides sclopetarius]|uniref:Uncharacterized protein n=1 Tax=Larinioides sclopetarius TaxID=280406 RepID=A0AAV2AAL2_9ARAC